MLKVLIAEDDLMIADMIEETLTEAGYEVCGIARTVPVAVQLCRLHRPSLAIIDVKLADGGLGTEIMEQLHDGPRLGVLYVTGNVNMVGDDADGDACLAKPYIHADLKRALKLVEQIIRNGFATAPFPPGFHFLQQKVRAGHEEPRRTELSAADLVAQISTLRRQQAVMAGFGGFALRQGDLLTVLTEAVRVCAEGMSVPFCTVCRYRAKENDLLIEAGFGLQAGVVGNVVSRADESSPQGRAFITGRPSVCNDVRMESNFKLPPLYAAHGIVSTIDVIIKGNGKPYGVLEIDNNAQHDYDEHDVNFLIGLANVLAEAVATSIRLSLLNTAITEKDRLLEQKDVFTGEFQHRVRNNMQLVHDMLSRQLDNTTDAAGQRGIRSIARRVFTVV